MNPLLATGIYDLAKGLLDRFFPDPQKKAEAELKLLEMQQNGELEALYSATQLALGQIKVNEVEAAHKSLFVAGWRPFVGWVCGLGLAYAVVFEPLLRFGAKVWFGYEGEFPEIHPTILMDALFGILGLGAMRSWEKGKGVAREK